MKKSIFILTELILSENEIIKQTTLEFPDAVHAKPYIDNTLKKAAETASKDATVDIEPHSGTGIQSMFGSSVTGNFSYRIGKIIYHYSFLKTKSEYEVSDEEILNTLEAFCNTGRTGESYRKAAELISNNMHRYVQTQLWRFVKEIIRAFARMNTDLRNKQAANEAATIAEYMETESI